GGAGLRPARRGGPGGGSLLRPQCGAAPAGTRGGLGREPIPRPGRRPVACARRSGRAMMISLDDDSASRQLTLVLRKAGHDVSTPADLGISGAPDPVHLTRAIRDGRVLLTRNARDFTLLHDPVRASGGGHPDNDPTRDLTPKAVAAAIAKLEASGVPISNELHVLNHWR